MKAKIFRPAGKSANAAKARGFRVQTGIRAGYSLQYVISSIPANLRSYS
jgi:hypothetical protein